MKNISKFVPALLVAGVLALTVPFMTRAKADPTPRTAAVVVFSATQYWENGLPTGYKIYVVSKGHNAPLVLPGSDLGQTLEDLVEQRFEIQNLPGLTFMAIRK